MKRIATGFLEMILGLLLTFDLAGGSALVSPLYLPLVNRASPIIAWTSSPAAKIQPTTHWVNEHELTFEGALGSTEAYQVVISADIPLSGVNLSASNLSDQQGHTIPASSFTFYREAFIDYTGVVETEPGNQPVPKNSPTGDTRLPDPMIPFIDPYTPGRAVGAPFAVAAGFNQPVWVDLAIPLDAVAGIYSGTITVSAAQQPSVVLPGHLDRVELHPARYECGNDVFWHGCQPPDRLPQRDNFLFRFILLDGLECSFAHHC